MQFLLQFNYIFIYLEQLQATFNNPKISQFIGIPAKENKKAVETISVPKVEEKKEEIPEIIEPEEPQQEEEEKKEENEYVGEEEKVSEEQVKQTDDEKAIELVKKEWGEDDSVIFSIENKKDNKIYVAVKQDATVIQWYEVNTTNWTISEY